MNEPSALNGARDDGPWPALAALILGAWLPAAPPTLGYGGAMMWSDLLTGGIVIVVSVLGLASVWRWLAQWALALVGVWLLHAPLLLWTESAAAYLNSTVIGILLIAFAVILPRGIWSRHPRDPDCPPGWSFNPSSWVQRTPIIALAWINFFMARYMAAYQLDHIDWPWDPFFADGTQRVLDSEVSEAFPVSDAGLGAAAYAIEALIGCMGSSSRWRTAPWTVALFGVLVVPVGVVSTVLIMLQPVAVGAWCTLCLITALFMLIMAALALPEVVAMLQFLARRRRAGHRLWETFWYGGDDPEAGREEPPAVLAAPPGQVLRDMVTGFTMPWSLVLSAVLGMWLMIAPPALFIVEAAAGSHYIVGALVITFSILSMAEVARALRFLNIPLALALAGGVFVLEAWTRTGQINAVLMAVLLIVLSIPRGEVRQPYGAWERLIR